MPDEKKIYTNSQYIGTAIFSSAILTPVRNGLNLAGLSKDYAELVERFMKLPLAGFSNMKYNILRGGGTLWAQLKAAGPFEGNTKVLVAGGVATMILTLTETPFVRHPYLPVAETPLVCQRVGPPLLIANPTLSVLYGLREGLFAKIVFNTDLPTLKGQSRRERIQFVCDISQFVATYGMGAWTSAMFHKLIVFHALEGLDNKLPNFRRDGVWPTLVKIGKNQFSSVGLRGHFSCPETNLKVAWNTAYALCPPVLFGMRVFYLGAAKLALDIGFKVSTKLSEYHAPKMRLFPQPGARALPQNVLETKVMTPVPVLTKK